MSTTIGLQIGKAIYNILKNDASVNGSNLLNSDASLIQPAPLKDVSDPDVAITYEIDSMQPINVKRTSRQQTAPIYIVDFTCECFARDYSNSIFLADAVGRAFQEAETNGTFGTIKINGFSFLSASETYNKERRYYSKQLSFSARVLL